MNIDGPSSSSPPRHTSLPPSSAAQPSGIGSRNGTPKRSKPVADALAFGDEDAEDGEQQNTGARRRNRTRPQQINDIPIVKDAVGESVRESFETFLKT